MLSTPFAIAPAGVLGSGSAVARPYACAAVRSSLLAPVAVVQGTGVPFAGMARRRGAAFEGIAFQAALPTTQQHDPITPNDGTTPLGIHSPGRPKS
jgi:hypothetical protein